MLDSNVFVIIDLIYLFFIFFKTDHRVNCYLKMNIKTIIIVLNLWELQHYV
jgi:hypothetical protein